jgi:RNA polymerase sigma-70 factor (ECF subfamily)
MPLVAEQLPNLVQAARRHDAQAWDTLLKQHQLPLYAYVAELTRDRHTALDLVQETFASAVRHIATLRDDSKFASWLFGIAHQRCVQQFRRKCRREDLFADTDDRADDFPDATLDDPRDTLIRSENTEAFFALVEKLPAAQRSALLLHVLEDFSLEEIAIITAVPVGTVKSRLHHAKRALRQLVEDQP